LDIPAIRQKGHREEVIRNHLAQAAAEAGEVHLEWMLVWCPELMVSRTRWTQTKSTTSFQDDSDLPWASIIILVVSRCPWICYSECL